MRIYVESSVFGDYAPNASYQQAMAAIVFNRIRAGRDQLVVSSVTKAEIARAPLNLQQFYLSLATLAELLPLVLPARRLARAYIAGGALPRTKVRDALHVALATTARCDVLLSWDADITRPSKVAKYHQINLQSNQPTLLITTPDVFLQTYP